MVSDQVRDEHARQLWNHGYAEGWLARDREARQQQAAAQPPTWWERLTGRHPR